MNSLNRDGDWEQEFILRYGHCGGDKKRELERQNIINFIRTLLEEAKAEEQKRLQLLVDKTKEEIYKLKPVRTEILGDENLDLITKYQAVNMINLNGLPYTLTAQAISAISNKK